MQPLPLKMMNENDDLSLKTKFEDALKNKVKLFYLLNLFFVSLSSKNKCR